MVLQWLVTTIQEERVAEIAVENGVDRLIRKEKLLKI